MFSLENFVKRGLLDAVGKQPDFWVILNAANWAGKGVLTEADLQDIQAAIDAKNAPPVEETAQPVTSEPEEGG